MSSPKSGQGWSTNWCSWHFQDWSHEKTFQGCGQCCSSGNFWGHDLFIIEISSCCFKIAQIDFQTHLFWVHSFCLRPYGPRQYCPNSVTQCWPRIPRFVASSLIYRRTTSIPWPLSHYLKHIFEVNLRPGDKENKNGLFFFAPLDLATPWCHHATPSTSGLWKRSKRTWSPWRTSTIFARSTWRRVRPLTFQRSALARTGPYHDHLRSSTFRILGLYTLDKSYPRNLEFKRNTDNPRVSSPLRSFQQTVARTVGTFLLRWSIASEKLMKDCTFECLRLHSDVFPRSLLDT